MSKEAMKLALEGAANYIDALGGDSCKYRQALAEQPAQQVVDCHATGVCVQSGLRAEQPAQQPLDKKAENARELGLDYKPAQQEPVAWMFQHGETGRTLCVDAQQVKWGFEERHPSYQKIAPLYTSPPAQRTWVGLTDEEKSELDAEYGDDTLAHLDAIEAKLKEKNT